MRTREENFSGEGSICGNALSLSAISSMSKNTAPGMCWAANSPLGSPLRKPLQLAELHELSHAQNALGAGKRAAYGRENFLEELGVHTSEAGMEIALFGVNSPLKTANRRTYEAFGWEGLANQMLLSKGYRKQFQVRTESQAAQLLQQHGFHLRATPTEGWGY